MKASFKNEVHIEGLLYDHSLNVRVTGKNAKKPGVTYITGAVKIAVDSEMTNIIEVFYRYVTPTTNAGNPNATFATLKSIIDGKTMNYMEHHGKDNYSPVFIRADTSIGLNDFYSNRNNPEGEFELVSAKRNEGGFLHIIRKNELNEDLDQRNKFIADMVVTSARRIEADEEKETLEHMILRGVIFGFRNAILPVEFTLYNADGMNFFESKEPSSKEPFCTQVRGSQVSQTVMITRVDESAFGPALVKKYPRTRKEYEVESIFSQVSYPWDDEEFITADELRKGVADRELYLATVKKNAEDYKASKASESAGNETTVETKEEDFNF